MKKYIVIARKFLKQTYLTYFANQLLWFRRDLLERCKRLVLINCVFEIPTLMNENKLRPRLLLNFHYKSMALSLVFSFFFKYRKCFPDQEVLHNNSSTRCFQHLPKKFDQQCSKTLTNGVESKKSVVAV